MRRWILAALPLVILLGAAPAVRADAAPMPGDPQPQKAKLVIEVDAKAKQPRLIIPTSLMTPKKIPGQVNNASTIIGGVALTLAVVSVGFWFIRKGPGRNVAAAVAVVSLFALGVSALYADIGPPRPKPPVPVKLPADLQLQEEIMVEFVEKGDAIKLIVNKATPAKAEAPKEKSE
jgi:hypothetical protein